MKLSDAMRGGKKVVQHDPGMVVRWCPELARVLALPVKPPATVDLTPEFRRPGSTQALRSIQSEILGALRARNGVLAAVGVGWGKTLAGLLAGKARPGTRRTVYLMPAAVRGQAGRDYAYWNEHFYLPVLDRELFLVSYEELSSADDADILERLQPDLIVADEAHCLRHASAARTKRFLRYCRKHGPALVAMSGTLTTRSLFDYAHLGEIALGQYSPLPSPTRAWSSLKEWAEALDADRPGQLQRLPGKLLELCTEEERRAVEAGVLDATAAARAGFRRRLVATPGVVATEEGALEASLVIRKLSPAMPLTVAALVESIRKTWKVGDEEIEEAARMWAVLRQAAMGFYYTWDWGVAGPDEEWLAARQAWHREVREQLSHRARPGMDSPKLLADAADDGRWSSSAWRAWKAVRGRAEPKPTPVWVDRFVVDRVRDWLSDKEPGIVWYEHRAVGQMLEMYCSAYSSTHGLTVVQPGADVPEGGHVALSIKAFRTGLNLQAWARNLVLCPPASGEAWEQFIGRTHRPKQKADVVTVDWFGHTRELVAAYEQALRDADYLQATMGQVQKLCYASKV